MSQGDKSPVFGPEIRAPCTNSGVFTGIALLGQKRHLQNGTSTSAIGKDPNHTIKEPLCPPPKAQKTQEASPLKEPDGHDKGLTRASNEATSAGNATGQKRKHASDDDVSVSTSTGKSLNLSPTPSTPQRKKLADSALKRKGRATPIKKDNGRRSSTPAKSPVARKASSSATNSVRNAASDRSASFPWSNDEESDDDGMPVTKGKKYHCG